MNYVYQLSSVIFILYSYFKTVLPNRTFHSDGTVCLFALFNTNYQPYVFTEPLQCGQHYGGQDFKILLNFNFN